MQHRHRNAFGRRAALASSLLAVALVLAAAPAAQAEVICVDDSCDGGLWKNARGGVDEISYWGMTPGHNCTNYVAWKLGVNGVERPPTGPGNAGDWAANARIDGYLVNAVPEVGAVAHWDAGTGEGGGLGHVAYVEEINDDGTIRISEDFWRADASGRLTFRNVPIDAVSNFIHYIDTSDWLRIVVPSEQGWRATTTGLDPQPSLLSSFVLDGVPTVVLAGDGGLSTLELGAAASVSTGLAVAPSSLSAVTVRKKFPFVMTVEQGALVMNARSGAGWQRMPTGVLTDGEIAAVDLDGLWPTVFISEGGALYRVWSDMSGWHVEPTWLESRGPITATVNEQGWPEVYGIHGGFVQRSWRDDTGWHQSSTGIPALDGSVAATSAPGVTTVFLATGGQLLRLDGDASGWRIEDTGLAPGSVITAVATDSTGPIVVQSGAVAD